MNRILFERDEIIDGIATVADARAEHILDVLHGEVGQILKTGEVNGPIGTGEIVAIEGRQIMVRVTHDMPSIKPWVDVILAPPRPRVMKRLLPQLAALGVGRIVLVGAEKVEKDFWGATLLKEENYRPLLVDGLMQCGASILPTLEVWKSFNRFLREALPTFKHVQRLVAHPYGNSTVQPSTFSLQPSLLLAVGPEGGWTNAEVEKLEATGFFRYSLGPRILRTDTATVALLAQLMPR